MFINSIVAISFVILCVLLAGPGDYIIFLLGVGLSTYFLTKNKRNEIKRTRWWEVVLGVVIIILFISIFRSH